MGAFNTLLANATCPVCKKISMFDLQFKFGDTWQHKYEVGQRLKWGGNDIGTSGLSKVAVEAIGDPCPNCGTDNLNFNVVIESDVIVGVEGLGRERKTFNPSGFVVLSK